MCFKCLKQEANTCKCFMYMPFERHNKIIFLAFLAVYLDSFLFCFLLLLLLYFTPGMKREFKHHHGIKLEIQPDQELYLRFFGIVR